ncbi:MFS multidrug transporter-like protein [Rhexocercosporidium sp. MPI-PUGE-AT-0058]|nr:MFS multidrug transporter-like protein [Rhexocercosporidium sp. MPI-PUGE-AT-0058]
MRTSPSTRQMIIQMGFLEELSLHMRGFKKPAGVLGGEHQSETVHLTGFKLHILTFGLTLAAMLMMLNASIVATAIPEISKHYKSIEDIGWYGSVYLLTNCSMQPLSGKLYTIYSLKWTFLTFLGIFELGALVAAASISSTMFIVGRAIGGIGGAGLMNGALTIIASAAPITKRPMLVGIIMSVSVVGQALGPLIGGAFTQYASWRWCFYINIPAGAITGLVLCFIEVPDERKKYKTHKTLTELFFGLDLIGFSLFAPACIMFLMALQWGGIKHAWDSAMILGLFCGSFVTAAVFAFWEQRQGKDAMIPTGMIKRRIVYSSCLTAMLQMGSLLLITYYLPIWFQSVKKVGPTMSGVMILPTFLAQIPAAAISSILITRLGYYLPWAMGGSAITTIGSGLMGTFELHTSQVEWVMYQILTGVGRGLVLQIPIIATQSILAPSEISTGSALVVLFQLFGGAIFICCGQTIFTNRFQAGLLRYAPEVDAGEVVRWGVARLNLAVPEQSLDHILQAYNYALIRTFYLGVAGSFVAFFTSIGMGWKSLKTVKPAEDPLEYESKSGLEYPHHLIAPSFWIYQSNAKTNRYLKESQLPADPRTC